jgi:hypothetical protein
MRPLKLGIFKISMKITFFSLRPRLAICESDQQNDPTAEEPLLPDTEWSQKIMISTVQ